MSSLKPLTGVDVTAKCGMATLATVLGIVVIVLGAVYDAPSLYAISVVLASTAVFYLQHTGVRAYVGSGAVLVVLAVLAGFQQTVFIAIVSFIAVFALAWFGRHGKFFWEVAPTSTSELEAEPTAAS